MKKLLSIILLLAVTYLTTSCNKNALSEITTTASPYSDITNTVANTATFETVSEFSELASAEIDYIDENGEIFYKNPTEWTFEKVFEELRINGQQFESPLTFDKLGEGFEFSDGEYDTTYSSSNGKINKMLKLRDKYICSVTFINCKDENDFNKPFYRLELSLPGTSEEHRSYLTINGIGIGSTAEETFEKLGIPYSRFGNSFIYTAANIKDTYGSISLAFYDGKLSVMTIGLYDDVD